jgi:hypothetical protein
VPVNRQALAFFPAPYTHSALLDSVGILPAATGEDSYGLSVCFSEMASVGSSHNRPTSAEDHEEALLLGCPPIGRSEEIEQPHILSLKRRGFTAHMGKQQFASTSRDALCSALGSMERLFSAACLFSNHRPLRWRRSSDPVHPLSGSLKTHGLTPCVTTSYWSTTGLWGRAAWREMMLSKILSGLPARDKDLLWAVFPRE